MLRWGFRLGVPGVHVGHAALFEDYMVVVYQISRIRAGIHPMVAMLEECPALAPLRDLHNQLRRLL